MNVIHFARSMRALGWKTQRLSRGRVQYGCHFGGQGLVLAFDTFALAMSALAPRQFAALVTDEANRRYGPPLGKTW